ncbi:MAG TPA: hypothetical protein PK289_08100 [Bacteroidia bacterium]|jgi:hypothetical protein|nr:hypothetical protein [Bacteroidia bacterium]
MKKILFLLLPLVFFSCNKETTFTEVSVGKKYSIQIPTYMKPCNDIQKDASLQYQNLEKDIYAIVIDEKKVTMQNYDLNFNLDTYYNNISSQGFSESIKNGKISIPGRQEINGNKALVSDITGKLEENEVFYKFAVIESPYEFYQILTWTRAEHREKMEKDMIKIIESFKELPHPKEELPTPGLSDSVSIQQNWPNS